jgi:hypothetical protein
VVNPISGDVDKSEFRGSNTFAANVNLNLIIFNTGLQI